ncbi:MAG: 50S ribosomal protein L32 [Candidatus Auribacterota bacterium]|jgi:large subunit ribosomal protein L32|nr:50S ribosomal protein L32 [Candidatus Auribacterota bacterium]
MPNPKKKMSRTRRNKRRTHYVLEAPQLSTCENCGSAKMPHRICPGCGFYGGRKIVEVEEGV